MAQTRLVIGPPGTGKTHEAMVDIGTLLDNGVPLWQIAFSSFSRAAVKEARDRVALMRDLDPEDGSLGWFRTLHSMAKKLVGHRGRVMLDQHWKEFAEVCRYDFSDQPDSPLDGDFYTQLKTAGDELRQIDQLARLRMETRDRVMLARPNPNQLTPEHAREFSRRLSWYKREHDLIDFTDMLEMALAGDAAPPVRFAFIDEAQDCCRLHYKLIEHWFQREGRHCEEVVLIGDDDQAIHVWAGAAPELLQDAAERYPVKFLTRSKRVPQAAHPMAMSITKRMGRRIPKTYLPSDHHGNLLVDLDLARALDAVTEFPSILCLVRNHFLAPRIVRELLSRGELFATETGPEAPLQQPSIVAAVRGLLRLLEGRPVSHDQFYRITKLIPARKDGHEVIPRGTKKAARENAAPVSVERLRLEFGMAPWLDHVRSLDNPFDCFLALEEESRHYLGRATDRLRASGVDVHRELKMRFTVTSIHRSKGREADGVLIEPMMASASYEELMCGSGGAEDRAAYVAATRTKDTLVILEQTSKRCYPYRSHAAAR